VEYSEVRGAGMSNETGAKERTSERDVWRKLSWIIALGGSVYMLYYEYLWSRFALHNRLMISFGGWFWISLAIMSPWNIWLIGLSPLREGIRSGKVGSDVGARISVWVALIMACAYSTLAPEIHRLMSLGIIK
jgi:hypothetical protein